MGGQQEFLGRPARESGGQTKGLKASQRVREASQRVAIATAMQCILSDSGGGRGERREEKEKEKEVFEVVLMVNLA